MTYDFFGAWDEKTGTNAPLYYQGFGNEAFNVDACVENYVALGVPRAKINIGLPFYGRSFKFASELNQIHGGSDTANWGEGMYISFNVSRYHSVSSKFNLINSCFDFRRWNTAVFQYTQETTAHDADS